ncbi:MAG: hypothetical protein NTV71_00065, partial [Candidatus Omnitrophica bacterium]|nr:hypothetical protein [Candidatus Omnitrophota bacterium]
GVVPARAAICFGLALRGLADPFIDINLCRKQLLVYKKKELFIKAIFLEASLAVFLLIVFKVFVLRAIMPLTDELNKTLFERPKIEVNVKSENITDLEKIKNEMESRKNIMENLIASRTYFTPRLQDLISIIPTDMWLSEVVFEEKIDKKKPSKITRFLSIKGYYLVDEKVSEKGIIDIFLNKLREAKGINKGMSKVDIVSVKRMKMNEIDVSSFEIYFKGP